jgi:digeranylgeranylglycerophospholipid reductase
LSSAFLKCDIRVEPFKRVKGRAKKQVGSSGGSSVWTFQELVENRDVVVVGAGIAGCMAAATVALKGKGKVDVLLLDRNPPTEVGKKNTLGWVCGDAVGEHHIKYVHDRVGVTYGLPEMENHVTAVYVFSPDMGVRVPFEGPGFVLDRPKFAKRLLDDALKAGVDYLGNSQATDLIAESGKIVGLVGQTVENGVNKPFEIRTKLILDTSGMSTKLRRSLPIQSFIEKEIDKNDVEPTARINARLADGVQVETNHCDIYLDQEKAPGGYLWLFPKSEDKVNIGLGIQQKRTHKPLSALLKDWVATDPRFKNIQPLTDDSNLNGAWQVSVRHQNDCLVSNGYMVCGDAAWFPNPISAGGIGPGLIGGVMAGETAVRAVEAGDSSERQLWQYNLDFVERYGNKTAGLEAFRLYLQTLNNKEINYGMRNFLSASEATEMSLGEMPELSGLEKFGKLLRGLGSYKAFKGLVYTMSRMKQLNELYQNYPKDPSQFEAWKKKVDSLLDGVRERFN